MSHPVACNCGCNDIDSDLHPVLNPTSNISNDPLDEILLKMWPFDEPPTVDYELWLFKEAKQALTAYIQQEKSDLLNELLEQGKGFKAGGVPVVPVSVIEAQLEDLNQGGEDHDT